MSQPQTTAPVTSSPRPIPAGEPIWVDLTTPAPQRTRAFYAALFGWEYQVMEEFGGYANAHRGGKRAAGIAPAPPQGMEGPGAWTVYFASDDLRTDAARVADLGGQVVFEPMQVGEHGHMGVFRDPGGATFGLWQPTGHPGRQGEGEGQLVWVEVNTDDPASALAFYRRLLNADARRLAGTEYHQLQHGEHGFAGVSASASNWEAVDAGGWMVYFSVGNVDRAAQGAEHNGGRVLVAPFDMDYGRMAVLADPDGTPFSVMNPQPAGG